MLCVRWSNDGRYLASSSDNDNVIIIWERDRYVLFESIYISMTYKQQFTEMQQLDQSLEVMM